MTRTYVSALGRAARASLVMWALVPFQAGAQTAPVPPAPATVVAFPPAGVPITEAVRLTIDHQAAIDLAEVSVARQQGVVQEQQGAFDWTLSSRLFYSYRQQELPEARKEIERNKRAQIRKAVQENRANAARAQSLIAGLDAIPTNAAASNAQIDAIAAIDQPLASQLRILDALIASNTNAQAVAAIRTERNTLISSARAQLRSGVSDFVKNYQDAETSLANLGEAPSDELFYQFNGSAQLSRAFRSGISMTPFLQGTMEGTNFLDKPRSSDFGGKGVEPIYTVRAGLGLTIPLLRGRGANATGGAERAAKIEVDATRLALRHQSDVSALETARAYWDLRAAQVIMEVTERSVKNQQRLVELTQAQAKAGTLPGIEVSRVQASEARSRARLDDATRSFHEAQLRLVDVMGLGASDDPATLPRAADDFPATPPTTDLGTPLVAALATAAAARRADLQAAIVSEQAGRALADTLQTFTRSRLDLTTKVWWTALDDLVNFVADPADPSGVKRQRQEEGFGGIFDRWVGPSVETSLDYEKPLGNNSANGRLAQQRAELRRRELSAADLRRTVRLGVLRTARALAESVARVRSAEDAVKFADATLQGDFERFRSGDITLIDTILTEEQQSDAVLALVAARRDVARLLAELRFESGQLLSHQDGKAPGVDRSAFTTVPTAAGGR
ncbi:MAG: TolC family protein [Acidobacteria bacterium]|nr:TolC family protein [Acidobacteriota bacterium]